MPVFPPQSSHVWGVGHCTGQVRDSKPHSLPEELQLHGKATLPKDKARKPSTGLVPPLRYLAAGHKASPPSISTSSCRPPAPSPAQLTLSSSTALHPFRGKQEEKEAAASPSAAAQPGTAHTQLRGQLCVQPQGQVTAKTRGISVPSTLRFEPSAR